MNTLQNELGELLGDTPNIIMSDGLDVDLGAFQSIDQILEVDGVSFVCSVLRAKAVGPSKSLSYRMWEFDLEVPGLSLSDVINIDRMVFHYNNESFESHTTFELTNPGSMPIMTFTANRILNNDA